MAIDKKVQAGQLRLVLLRELGNAFVCDSFDEDKLKQTLTTCRTVDARAAAGTGK
jgi:3-dehydroquinate synthase